MFDTQIEGLARAQEGVISRNQVIERDGTVALVRWRLETRRWSIVAPDVYVLAGWPRSWRQQLWIGVLGTSDGIVSHRAAAQLWNLDTPTWDLVEISGPYDAKIQGTITHETHDLRDENRSEISGIPVTDVDRTLVDLGMVLSDQMVERSLEAALRLGLTTVNSLDHTLMLHSQRGRKGPPALRRVLTQRSADAAPTGSNLETRFAQLMRKMDIGRAIRQQVVTTPLGERYFDSAWPDRKVAVELDGWESHGTKEAFIDDRQRQNALVLLGWTILRFTWTDVTKYPERTANIVRDALQMASKQVG